MLHFSCAPIDRGSTGLPRWVRPLRAPGSFQRDPARSDPALPNRFPYFPFYPTDFAMSTSGWPPDAVGTYLRLLIYQWEHDRLPSDELGLATACNSAHDLEKFQVLWSTWLEPKFASDGNGNLVNLRLDYERRKITDRHERLSEAGRKGGKVSRFPKAVE